MRETLAFVELPAPLPVVPLSAWLVLALFALVVALVVFWQRGAPARRLRAQWARAARGEVRAETLLANTGWKILGRQVGARYELKVDGAPTSVLVRADFVVGRGGRRYVAEVKTGRWAPRIETSATRRQLLEYRIAFGADGVLLVDVEGRKISFVEFPAPAPQRSGWLTALLRL